MNKLDRHMERLMRMYGPTNVLRSASRAMAAHLEAAAFRKRDAGRVPELVVWTDFREQWLDSLCEEAEEIEDWAGYPYDQRHRPEMQGKGGYLELLFPWVRR